MANWLYTANSKLYDVPAALAAEPVYWPASTSVQPGDTVYLYLAAPQKQIAWVCTAVSVGLPEAEVIDACRPFFRQAPKAGSPKKNFMQIRVSQRLALAEDSPVSYSQLREQGLKGMLMGPRKLDNAPQLLSYIQRQCAGAENG